MRRKENHEVMPYECAVRLASLPKYKQKEIAEKYYGGNYIWKIIMRDHKYEEAKKE